MFMEPSRADDGPLMVWLILMMEMEPVRCGGAQMMEIEPYWRCLHDACWWWSHIPYGGAHGPVDYLMMPMVELLWWLVQLRWWCTWWWHDDDDSLDDSLDDGLDAMMQMTWLDDSLDDGLDAMMQIVLVTWYIHSGDCLMSFGHHIHDVTWCFAWLMRIPYPFLNSSSPLHTP